MKKAKKITHQSTPEHIETNSTADQIIAELRTQGFRMTKTRRALIEILNKAESPLSVFDLIQALAVRKIAVNKTTVYRELEFLREQKLALEVDLLDGCKRYEIVHEGHHHHHLVCTNCNEIQCVEMHNDLDALERSISKNHKFQVTSHVLEFFGLCERCS